MRAAKRIPSKADSSGCKGGGPAGIRIASVFAPCSTCRFEGESGILESVTSTTLDPVSDPPATDEAATKRVLLLKPRGFCAGVVRAIDIVQIALETFGAPIYVRKEIVHNSYVVTDLAKKGAIFVNELDEVPEGARVIYSAHGVSPAVREAAKARGSESR